MNANVQTILAAVELLAEPGSVVECRMLFTKRGTISGYYDDFARLAQDAASWDGRVPNVYVTLNPVRRDLLARASNRLMEFAKHATSDDQILHRRWFGIDCDAIRPSGISATRAERDAAYERAVDIALMLDGLGFPHPVRADSGNGGHLLYRIDLPNDDDALALLTRCIGALDFEFGDGLVSVDKTTVNASRIWKLYGTMACKGDSTQDRPHRRSEIIDAPDPPQVVHRELLEALAARLPAPAKQTPTRSADYKGEAFDLDAWILRHGLDVFRESPWSGGRKWILRTCPWNGDHTDRSAFITQSAGGTIAAGCHHNGCSGRQWKDLRTLYEPDAYTPKETEEKRGPGRPRKERPALPSPVETTDEEAQEDGDRAAFIEGLPVIETLHRRLRDVTADALGALVAANEPPTVFVRAGHLARIDVDEIGGARVGDLNLPKARGILERCANFISTGEKRGCIPVHPPHTMVEDLLARPQWPTVPHLAGIVTAPIFAPDGSYHHAPGYSPASRMYYHARCPVPLGDTTPTAANMTAAKALLDQLLIDFPFAQPAAKAHAVALILQPFARLLFDGPAPLYLIDAPRSGTGKTLLAIAATSVFLPGGAATKVAPSAEEEWSKMLTSIFLEGGTHLLLDNVVKLTSGTLFSALTTPTWKDRRLGLNESVELPNRLTWIATCNNALGGDELTRRAVWIRLDAGLEQPDERTGFVHPDLMAWIRAERGALVTAVLTIIRGWIDNGRPNYSGKNPPLGSFEGWTNIIGGILENAEIDDFLDNRQQLRDAVEEGNADVAAFVQAWHEAWKTKEVTPKQLVPIAKETIPERVDAKNEAGEQAKLGRLLKTNADRIFGGWKIRAGRRSKTGVIYYLETGVGMNVGVGSLFTPYSSIQNSENGFSELNDTYGGAVGEPSSSYIPSPDEKTGRIEI